LGDRLFFIIMLRSAQIETLRLQAHFEYFGQFFAFQAVDHLADPSRVDQQAMSS